MRTFFILFMQFLASLPPIVPGKSQDSLSGACLKKCTEKQKRCLCSIISVGM